MTDKQAQGVFSGGGKMRDVLLRLRSSRDAGGKLVPSDFNLEKYYGEDVRGELAGLTGPGRAARRTELVGDAQKGQAALTEKLIQYALLGGATGVGMGLYRQLPKMLALKKEIPQGAEKEAQAATTATTADSNPLSKLLAKVKGTAGKAWAPLPKSVWDVPFLGMHGGGRIAAPALAIGGALAADRAVDWLTDRSRKRKVEKRREELRKQFNELLIDGDENTEKIAALTEWIDEAAESFDKEAVSPAALITPLMVALMGIGGYSGFQVGKELRKRTDPGRVRLAALQHAIKAKSRKRPLSLQIEAVAPEEVEDADTLTSTLSPAEATTGYPVKSEEPEVMPKGEYDEAFDLTKLSAADILMGEKVSQYVQGRGLGRPGAAIGNLAYEAPGRLKSLLGRGLQFAGRNISEGAGVPKMREDINRLTGEVAGAKGQLAEYEERYRKPIQQAAQGVANVGEFASAAAPAVRAGVRGGRAVRGFGQQAMGGFMSILSPILNWLRQQYQSYQGGQPGQQQQPQYAQAAPAGPTVPRTPWS